MYCIVRMYSDCLRQEIDDEADENATTNINFLH